MPRRPDPGQMSLPTPNAAPSPAAGASPRSALTVSHVTRLVKDALESALPAVWIVGEISNFKRHASGHLYFSLRDEHAGLNAVMWGSRAEHLRFDPRDGVQVLAFGRLGVYEPRGVYQLYVDRLEPVGLGEMQAAFARLCGKLKAEGLFDPKRKRRLPALPRRIAVVTSPVGAAVRDLIQVIHRRCPITQLVVYPVRVQGDGAAAEIAFALDHLNRAAAALGGIDVIIAARGGGSLEDLWAFNEEAVARAVFRSAVPIVSAVGHETDVTIADLVADQRAPTPTAAGELAVPVLAELIAYLDVLGRRAGVGASGVLTAARRRWEALARRRPFADPTAGVRTLRQRVDDVAESLDRAARVRLDTAGQRAAAAAGRLEALSPLAVLARGYSIVQTAADGRVIRRAQDVAVGEVIRIRPAAGEITAVVSAVAGGSSPEGTRSQSAGRA